MTTQLIFMTKDMEMTQRIKMGGAGMKIAIDFDGTCVTHEYPDTGKGIGSEEVLKDLVKAGHDLILYTMRSAGGLDRAIDWFIENKIKLYGVQYDPEQTKWTSSNKCYAHLYIDDAALGIPLIQPMDGKKPYVDWVKVREMLIEKGYL
jgi:hypothetical protein